jgi:hypothetical protein
MEEMHKANETPVEVPNDSREGAGGLAPEVLMSWRVSLAARDGLLRPFAALTIIICVLVIGAYMYRDTVLVSVSACILFLATADYFLPMRFWLTREAAFRRTIFGTKFMPWSKVKHCYLDEKGIKLSSLEKQSRSEAMKGLFLYFGDKRNELVEAVRNLAPANRG